MFRLFFGDLEGESYTVTDHILLGTKYQTNTTPYSTTYVGPI
jgi:hypothetical protein